MPNDYNGTLKSMCENQNYGNLLYDKYRDVYYRVCYLKTEIDNRENYMELWDFGRKIFSIIILDKNFIFFCFSLLYSTITISSD